jgi:beta-N-acetylhexosaminidase
MSLRDVRRHVGQLLFAGFDGQVVPPEVRSLVREFDLGALVLFRRNVVEPEQVAELVYEARSLGTDLPLWVGVDQEGGRVARLRAPFTEWPPMAALGRADQADALAGRFAAALASELAAVGITIDFAPVLDVHSNPANPVIGDRALSDRAERVAELGRIIIETLQAAGIAACGKHFPGHGDTSADSHHEMPVVEHQPDRLRAVEFVPFRAAIAAGVAAIMTAHVLVPAIDDERPATLSSRLVDGLLRGELGFEGLVLTDDLDMKAVSGTQPVDRAAVQALGAGCDGVLVCGVDHDRHAAVLESILRALESGELPLARVEDALARQRRARERFLANLPARPLRGRALLERIGRTEHAAIAEEMARYV